MSPALPGVMKEDNFYIYCFLLATFHCNEKYVCLLGVLFAERAKDKESQS
jgi:hypothetical protein